MHQQEYHNLTQSLDQLDAVLKSKAPALHQQFADGATDEQIDQLRASLGGKSIHALEAWFKWHNGATEPMLELIPLGEVVSIEQAIEQRALSLQHASSLRANSIMILEDGAGDGYFVDLTNDPALVYYEMLEDPSPTYYGTLTEFTKYIAEAYESGIFRVDDQAVLDYNEDEFEANEQKHHASATKR